MLAIKMIREHVESCRRDDDPGRDYEYLCAEGCRCLGCAYWTADGASYRAQMNRDGCMTLAEAALRQARVVEDTDPGLAAALRREAANTEECWRYWAEASRYNEWQGGISEFRPSCNDLEIVPTAAMVRLVALIDVAYSLLDEGRVPRVMPGNLSKVLLAAQGDSRARAIDDHNRTVERRRRAARSAGERLCRRLRHWTGPGVSPVGVHSECPFEDDAF